MGELLGDDDRSDFPGSAEDTRPDSELTTAKEIPGIAEVADLRTDEILPAVPNVGDFPTALVVGKKIARSETPTSPHLVDSRKQSEIATEQQSPRGRAPRGRGKQSVHDSVDGPDPLDGTRYSAIDELGRGGMGVVYLARHRDLGRPFAVKVLSKRMSADPVVVERMRREARTASQLRHPGIVDVTDFGKTPDGRAFIVMEHIEGQNVAKRIATDGPVDQEHALHVVLAVCRALAEAHAHDVIHRDIKPANIIVSGRDETLRVKVVDFGIALSSKHANDRLTQVGSMPGTPLYMAPEQARTRTSTVQTDVYALGVVLYEMLTGSPPFEASTGVKILALKIKKDPQPPSERAPGVPIHPSVENTVLTALARDPSERFHSMSEMAAAVEVALETLRAPDERESGEEHELSEEHESSEELIISVPWRRGRSLAVFALLAAVAVAGGFAVVRMTRQEREVRADDSTLALIQGHAVPDEEAGDASTDDNPTQAVLTPHDTVSDAGWEPTVDANAWLGVDEAREFVVEAPTPDAGAFDDDVLYDFSNRAVDRAPMTRRERRQLAAQLIAEGHGHLRARRYSKARVAYSRASRLDPGNVAAIGGMGRVAFEQGRHDEASRYLERALRSSPGNAGLRIVLGSAYLRMGQNSRAIEQWERVLRQNPDNAAAKRLLKSVR